MRRNNDDRLDALVYALGYIRQNSKDQDLLKQEIIGAQKINIPIKFRFYDHDGNEVDADGNIINRVKTTTTGNSGSGHNPNRSSAGNSADPATIPGTIWTEEEEEEALWETSLDELFGITPPPAEVDDTDFQITVPKEKEEKVEKGSQCPYCGSKNLGFTPNLANRCKDCEHIWS